MASANNEPLVSICIPVYNGAALISRALASALSQSYRKIEIVIADNASTDDTEAVVARYARRDERIRYSRYADHVEFKDNLWRSYQLATGDFIQLLCHDDWLSPNYIEEGVRNFLANPNAAAVFTKSITAVLQPDGTFQPGQVITFAPGNYSRDYFLGQMYRSYWASLSLVSLLRRLDLIEATATVIDYFQSQTDPVSLRLYQEGVTIDWLIFLKIFTKYDFLTFTDQAIYIKLDHPKNTGKFVGWQFQAASGIIHYYGYCRNCLEYLYATAFRSQLGRLRYYYGTELLSTLLVDFIKGRCAPKFLKGFHWRQLKRFFQPYRPSEKLFVFLGFIPSFIGRLARYGIRFLGNQIKSPMPTNLFFPTES